VIELDNVSVRYEAALALSPLSHRVEPGEWVGLIGPNGAGKSTLLKAVAGLVDHGGRISIADRVTTGLSRRQMAQLVAFVPQQPALPSDMSVNDYVMLGRTPHISYFGFDTAEDRRICGAVLERLELSSMGPRLLRTLSGGELQRLVLARALAQAAPVLLLDEPTSALDLGRRVDALELVDELRRDEGITVVSAMHDLTLAAQFAERLVLLASGAVMATGAPDSVLRENILTMWFGADVRVLRTVDGQIVVTPHRQSRRAAGTSMPTGARTSPFAPPANHSSSNHGGLAIGIDAGDELPATGATRNER
jgi:iron complex transport system ATP-binding protein